MLLNEAVLQRLEKDASLEVIPEIVSMFVRETRSRLARMSDALEQMDLACLESESHTLKSSAGTFGAAILEERARELELASKAGNADPVVEMMAAIEDAAECTIKALAERYNLEVMDEVNTD